MVSTLGPLYSTEEVYNQHGNLPFCVGDCKDMAIPTETYRSARPEEIDIDDLSIFPCFSSWLSFTELLWLNK